MEVRGRSTWSWSCPSQGGSPHWQEGRRQRGQRRERQRSGTEGSRGEDCGSEGGCERLCGRGSMVELMAVARGVCAPGARTLLWSRMAFRRPSRSTFISFRTPLESGPSKNSLMRNIFLVVLTEIRRRRLGTTVGVWAEGWTGVRSRERAAGVGARGRTRGWRGWAYMLSRQLHPGALALRPRGSQRNGENGDNFAASGRRY